MELSNEPKLKDLQQAIEIIRNYSGYDPYIQRIKAGYNKRTPVKLTAPKVDYVLKNYQNELTTINRTIDISEYYGSQLQRDYNLNFTPQKIHVYYYFGQTDKAFCVWGKLTKAQEPREYFIPKTQILGDLFYEVKKVEVDYSKYNALLSKVGRQVLPHQPEAVEFLLSRQKPILADGMGLCKTSSSIIASIEGGFKKILIVCPASLKVNWFRELQLLSIPESDIAIINGNKWIDGKKYTIINYDILSNFYEYVEGRASKAKTEKIQEALSRSELHLGGFDLIILDEAHSLSNSKSNRSTIIGDYVERSNVQHRWLLTGTPITKRPINFYNLLKLVKCPVVDDWSFYVKRYCEAKNFQKRDKITGKPVGKPIWVTSGASNLDELHNKTKHLILKRKIEDYIDMPEKIEIPQFYDLSSSQRSRYTQLYDEFIEMKLEKDLKSYMYKKNIFDEDEARRLFVNDLENLQSLVETGVIRKYLAMEMLPNTMELIDSALEEDNKIIIFTTFTDELMELYDKYKKQNAVIHYGGMTTAQKQASVDAFQNDKNCKIFIGNLDSAGVGITLTAADIEIFNSLHWLPGINEQAICRSWRNGRTLPVTIYFNLFSNTKAEEWFLQNMVKTKEINEIIK